MHCDHKYMYKMYALLVPKSRGRLETHIKMYKTPAMLEQVPTNFQSGRKRRALVSDAEMLQEVCERWKWRECDTILMYTDGSKSKQTTNMDAAFCIPEYANRKQWQVWHWRLLSLRRKREPFACSLGGYRMEVTKKNGVHLLRFRKFLGHLKILDKKLKNISSQFKFAAC